MERPEKSSTLLGKITTEKFEERVLTIYTPPSYNGFSQSGSFPVVYVQDGRSLIDPESTQVIFELEAYFQKREMTEIILVGIEPKNRLDEYTPWPAKALSTRFKDFGGEGKTYLDWVTGRLKPSIDHSYPTDKRPRCTGLMGVSLGGLISLYGACLYPHIFGKIASLSGSFWYEGFLDFVGYEKWDASNQQIYLDVGSLEGAGKKSAQRVIVENTKEIYQRLLTKGFLSEHIQLWIEPNTNHHHDHFAKRIPNALKWLMR